MGSSHSNSGGQEDSQAPGTTLWGSWDKPVANAYAEKLQQTKQSNQATTNFKSAADAAPQGGVQVNAGAGLNPVVALTSAVPGLKSAGGTLFLAAFAAA